VGSVYEPATQQQQTTVQQQYEVLSNNKFKDTLCRSHLQACNPAALLLAASQQQQTKMIASISKAKAELLTELHVVLAQVSY
jgi:hypothetical protein